MVYTVKLGDGYCLQYQSLYTNTHTRNRFNGLCTKCPGYNNNLVITAHFSGTNGVVVNKFDCINTFWSSSDYLVFICRVFPVYVF